MIVKAFIAFLLVILSSFSFCPAASAEGVYTEEAQKKVNKAADAKLPKMLQELESIEQRHGLHSFEAGRQSADIAFMYLLGKEDVKKAEIYFDKTIETAKKLYGEGSQEHVDLVMISGRFMSFHLAPNEADKYFKTAEDLLVKNPERSEERGRELQNMRVHNDVALRRKTLFDAMEEQWKFEEDQKKRHAEGKLVPMKLPLLPPALVSPKPVEQAAAPAPSQHAVPLEDSSLQGGYQALEMQYVADVDSMPEFE